MATALRESAQKCVNHLQKQKSAIEAARLRPEASTIRFELGGLVLELSELITSINQWKAEFGEGQEIYIDSTQQEVASDQLKQITDRADEIGKILPKLFSQKDSAQAKTDLRHHFVHIEETVQKLRTLPKVFRASEGPLQNSIADKKADTIKARFIKELREIPSDKRRNSFTVYHRESEIDFGALSWFWKKLPKVQELEGVDYFRGHNRKDGIILQKEHIEGAGMILRCLRDAWLETMPANIENFDQGRLDLLLNMSMITMILRITQKQEHFMKFLRSEKTDAYLPFHDLGFLGDDAAYIAAQQYRAYQREWKDGSRLILAADEPLPLEHQRSYPKGGSSEVDLVKDSWFPERFYARKKMTISSGKSNKEHMECEIKILQDLGVENHGHHIVKYVKTYERGKEFGILLTPAAKWNLNEMLEECARYPNSRSKYEQTLLKSFGCVSYSLAYIHNVKQYRHRDVKPHNIIFDEKEDRTSEFLWTDFGLAFNFAEQVLSGTYDTNFRATAEYEAPEIDHKPGSIHGRSVDVFALGCVFLEILSVLMLHKKERSDNIPFQKFYIYKDNLLDIKKWIEENQRLLKKSFFHAFSSESKKEDKAKETLLRELFDLSLSMINANPRERPKIDKIVHRVANLRHAVEENPYLSCERCVRKYRVDSAASDARIFKHQKVNWHQRPFNYMDEVQRKIGFKVSHQRSPS